MSVFPCFLENTPALSHYLFLADHLTNMSESFESYFKTCNGDPGAWTTGQYINRSYNSEEIVVKIITWSGEINRLLEEACTAIPGSVSIRIETDTSHIPARPPPPRKKSEYIVCENERGLRHGERDAPPTLEWPKGRKNPRWKE